MYSNTVYTNAVIGTAAASTFSLVYCCLCLFYIVLIILGIVAFIFWIVMLIDLIQRNDSQFGESAGKDSKLLWLLVVLFTHWIGALVYYFVIYKKYPR